jgi:hypothetical protein
LNIRLGEFEARRTTIHHHAHAATVRFTPGCDAEQFAKRICHAASLGEKGGPVKRATPGSAGFQPASFNLQLAGKMQALPAKARISA